MVCRDLTSASFIITMAIDPSSARILLGCAILLTRFANSYQVTVWWLLLGAQTRARTVDVRACLVEDDACVLAHGLRWTAIYTASWVADLGTGMRGRTLLRRVSLHRRGEMDLLPIDR